LVVQEIRADSYDQRPHPQTVEMRLYYSGRFQSSFSI
jgi:hypothetical protein